MKLQYTAIIKRMLFIGLVFAFHPNIIGQHSNENSPTDPLEKWMGNWQGTLQIYNHNGLTQTVPMQVRNFYTDTIGTYGWYLIYGDVETGTRAYYLKTVDKEKGDYIIDEKNSILLQAQLIHNKMISTFEIQNNLITSIYTLLEDGKMEFEIFFSDTQSIAESGNTLFDEEEIPLVKSFPIGGYQKAILYKE